MHESDRAARRRATARAIQRRMVAHVAAGGTTDFAAAPLENDPSAYTDPTRAALEIRRLFLDGLLVAGLSCDVPAPGSTRLFEDVGTSILIVRGRDGLLRGFLNMCTHRGNKLVRDEADARCERRRLTCGFHAWSFDLDGSLAAVPGRQGFDGIDLADRNLRPVPVAEWNGLVFVRPSPGPDPPDVPGHLGAFAAELEPLNFSRATPVRSSHLTAACNWKLALDTYAEGYHFATLHASTIGTTHYSNVAVFDDFAPHWRLNFPDRRIRALVGRPEEEWPEPDVGGVYFLFPNTVAVLGSSVAGGGFLRLFRLFPGAGPGTMACRISVYTLGGSADAQPVEAQFAQDDAESEVTQEDYRVAVDSYANLVNAPPGFRVVYGRNEPALQSVHRSIARAIGIPLGPRHGSH